MRLYFARHHALGGADNLPFHARYGIVVVCVAAAYLLTESLPAVHQFTPFLFYILAVRAGAIYGGIGPGMLVIERVPLATVFRNLIQNAYKHHHDPDHGCVTITASEADNHQGAGQDDMAEFNVADDGPGIAPEYHTQIFELFRTLKPRDQFEGSGMGLSIVKKTVESRGGTITLTSVPAQGATFTFAWLANS